MTTTVQFQDRTFRTILRDDGLHEVRYSHDSKRPGRRIDGVVASRDLARLPHLLKVQSAAMGGAQILPRDA